MATPGVVVPWRPGCPHREAAWSWLRPRYPWPVHEGTTTGPWCKAAAVADALTSVTADILVIADADVWTGGLQVAVDAVEAGAAWAVPHLIVHRLDEASTAAVLAGGPLTGTTTERPYKGHAGGGVTVLRRDLYEQIPLDPRFTGWGHEDDSWAVALTTLAGQPWRGTADLWHLWHPPQPRLSRRVGSHTSRRLLRRYVHANNDPARMRALIEEAAMWATTVKQRKAVVRDLHDRLTAVWPDERDEIAYAIDAADHGEFEGLRRWGIAVDGPLWPYDALHQTTTTFRVRR